MDVHNNTESVSLIFPVLQTKITSQMWPMEVRGRKACDRPTDRRTDRHLAIS